MAKEVDGALGFFLVPVAATPTAVLYEITSDFALETTTKQAINKGSSSFLTQVPTNQSWTITGSSHLDDVSDLALLVIRDAAVGKTLLADCEFDTSATGWKATGDCYVTGLTIGQSNDDFVVVGYTVTGTGAIVFA